MRNSESPLWAAMNYTEMFLGWRVSISQRPLASLLQLCVSIGYILVKYKNLLDYWQVLCMDLKSNILYRGLFL